MKQATKTSVDTGDGIPALLGVSEIHQRQHPHFFISLHYIQCCYCNSILQYSLLGESTHMICLHRLCNPQHCGAASRSTPSKRPPTQQREDVQTAQPPNPAHNLETERDLSDDGLTYNTHSALPTLPMTTQCYINQ